MITIEELLIILSVVALAYLLALFLGTIFPRRQDRKE